MSEVSGSERTSTKRKQSDLVPPPTKLKKQKSVEPPRSHPASPTSVQDSPSNLENLQNEDDSASPVHPASSANIDEISQHSTEGGSGANALSPGPTLESVLNHPFFSPRLPLPLNEFGPDDDAPFFICSDPPDDHYLETVLPRDQNINSNLRHRYPLDPATVREARFTFSRFGKYGTERVYAWPGAMVLDGGKVLNVWLRLFCPEGFFQSVNDRLNAVDKAKKYAANEARAYSSLKDLQGGMLPWSYGFYKFFISTPRMMAYGHVVEFIPYPSLAEWLPFEPDCTQKQHLLNNLVSTINQFRSRKMLVGSLNRDNVLRDSSGGLIITGFEEATAISDKTDDDKEEEAEDTTDDDNDGVPGPGVADVTSAISIMFNLDLQDVGDYICDRIRAGDLGYQQLFKDCKTAKSLVAFAENNTRF